MFWTIGFKYVSPIPGKFDNAAPDAPTAIRPTAASRKVSASCLSIEPVPSAQSKPTTAPNTTRITSTLGITPGATPATTETKTPSMNR